MQRNVLVAWMVMSLGAPPGFRSCHTPPGTGGAGGGTATGGTDGGDGGTGTPQEGQGAACAAADQCASGFCVDGFCCDTACSGLCQACSNAVKGAGADGTCGYVVAGGDARGQCVDQGAASCGTDGACDGAGACQEYASGTVCVPASCDNEGAIRLASTCDGAGTCTAGGVMGCLPYNCSGDTCLTSCTSDGDCAGSPQDPPYCDASGRCMQKQFPGAPCTGDDQCYTGTCTDGVCCNEGCGTTCQTCAAAGMVGQCELVPAGANNPNHPCPDGGVCNGLGPSSAACM
jgi:hypothetical protein